MQTFPLSNKFVPVLAAALVAACGAASAAAPAQGDQETQVGDEIYKKLAGDAEIIVKSPLYATLHSVTAPVAAVAGRHYNHPFKFILVHEKQPNAFSVPGGNVYVVDSLMTFARNREELTGVLCHEVSHTLHHDSMKKIQQQKRRVAAEAGALLVLGPTIAHAIAIDVLGDLRSNGYSREMESAADITGADVCAAAGYNPYGLVWLFQDFQNADPNQLPQLLSDHPSFKNRIQALLAHFRQNPAVFSRFSPDRSTAHPLNAPRGAWVVFGR
jgi:predicted Zn-dependent protease